MRNDLLDQICTVYGIDPMGRTRNEILECIIIATGGSTTGDETRNELLEKIVPLV